MESIAFCLKTTQINSSVTITDYYNKIIDNVNGRIENNMANFTWRNVNLRNLLGKLYDEYDEFNICLISVSNGVRNGTTGDNTSQYQVIMSGLNFLSSQNINNNSLTIGIFKQNIGGAVGDSVTIDNNFFTFTKLNDIIDINIKLLLLLTNDFITITNASKMVNHYIFNFIIQPCKKTNRKYLF